MHVHGQLIVDESYKDKSFWSFKQQLERVVMQQDTAQLKLLLAERVFESNDGFGYGGCNKDEFIKYYFSNTEEEYKHLIWDNIAHLLRFGFYQKIDEYSNHPIPHDSLVYIAPSYLKTIDTDNEIIVLSDRVNIRTKPSLSARILRTTSFERFRCNCTVITMSDTTFQTVDGIDWVEIVLADDKVGYIALKYTSHFIEKQLRVGKVKGKWKIIWYYNKPGC